MMTEQQGGPPEASDLGFLLRRAKVGDTAACEPILIQHDRRVFRMALRLLGCVEDAQDATQEVCLKLRKHCADSTTPGRWRPGCIASR